MVGVLTIPTREPLPTAEWPIGLAQQISELEPGQEVLNDYNTAGIVLFFGGQESRVGIDGRTDRYGAQYIADYVDLTDLKGDWKALLDELDPTSALLEDDSPLAYHLTEVQGWSVAGQESGFTLLVEPSRRTGGVTGIGARRATPPAGGRADGPRIGADAVTGTRRKPRPRPRAQPPRRSTIASPTGASTRKSPGAASPGCAEAGEVPARADPRSLRGHRPRRPPSQRHRQVRPAGHGPPGRSAAGHTRRIVSDQSPRRSEPGTPRAPTSLPGRPPERRRAARPGRPMDCDAKPTARPPARPSARTTRAPRLIASTRVGSAGRPCRSLSGRP